jgi:hypothetical protein
MITDDLAAILKTALPAAAAAYSLKKGIPFGAAYLKNQDDQQHTDLERRRIEQEGTYQTGELAARAEQIAAEREHYAAEAARADAVARTTEQNRINKLIADALDNAAENPAFMDMVNKGGPENFSLTVPGVGPINLKEAFARAPVIQAPDGTYQFGKPAPDPMVPFESVNPDGSKATELIRQSEAVKRGKHETAPPPKEPTDSFSPQPLYDDKGNIVGMGKFNTKTGEMTPVAMPAGAAGNRPPVGAAADKKEEQITSKAINTANALSSHLDEAESLGLLGPGGGRLNDLLSGGFGTTGDKRKDDVAAAIRTDFAALKPAINGAITGTTRGSASPQLKKDWDNIFAMKMSKEQLKSSIKELSAILGNGTTPPAGASAGAVRKYNPATGKLE